MPDTPVKSANKKDFSLSKSDLLEIVRKQHRPLRIDAILRATGLSRKHKRRMEEELRALAASGELTRMPGGFWLPSEAMKSLVGIYHSRADGGGYVTSSDPDCPELQIGEYQTGGAWHRDLVRALVFPHSKPPHGRIVEILERRRERVFARIVKRKSAGYLCKPVERQLTTEFMASHGDMGERLKLQPGTLVALLPEREITPGLWQAAFIDIYPDEYDVYVQEAIVKASHNVPGSFPPPVIQAAEALPPSPGNSDIARREDMRNIPFVTIDGATARDFDDAIFVEKTDNGWILRVAIADVSHYVPPDKAVDSLDSESLRRGNSWYFPKSVEPMLPAALSNGLCSLNPHEDRLAVLVEMPFDHSGKPGQPRFAQIVMRSAGRLIYEDVSAFFAAIKNNGGKIPDEHAGIPTSGIAKMLADAHGLYRLLADLRRKRGTIDFELPEPAYSFDDEGQLVGMAFAASGEANHLIEEFMIAANEAVAKYLGGLDKAFLYRVHPLPEPEKLQALLKTLKNIAPEAVPHGMDAASLAKPESFVKILMAARGRPVEYAVNRLCLRAMPQARYQTDNCGHFGLASANYCHFTSPIRRYADLTVHRALKNALGIQANLPASKEELDSIASELNKLEREAMECERDMAKRLACIVLSEHKGEVLSGTISGVTDFGLFVELSALPAEGFIPIRSLGDDWFELNQERQSLIGARGGQIWQLGQPIRVVVESVDLDRAETKLATAESPQTKRCKKGRPSKKTSKGLARSKKNIPLTQKKPRVKKNSGKMPDSRHKKHGAPRKSKKTGRQG